MKRFHTSHTNIDHQLQKIETDEPKPPRLIRLSDGTIRNSPKERQCAGILAPGICKVEFFRLFSRSSFLAIILR